MKELSANQVFGLYNKTMDAVRTEHPLNVYPHYSSDAVMQRFWKTRADCLKFERRVSSTRARGLNESL